MSDTYRLAQLGANESSPASTINLSVAGTVGPDYLGQETVDVDGHPNNRPGVKSRLPEDSDDSDPRISQMDTGEELPVLLSSEMRTDPIEGTQGSYTEIIEGECNRCGYDRIKLTVITMAGEHKETCNACGAIQDRGGIDDQHYRMPETPKSRMEQTREWDDLISDAPRGEIGLYDASGSEQCLRLVGDRHSLMFGREEFVQLFLDFAEYEDKTVFELLDPTIDVIQRANLYLDVLTGYWKNNEDNDGQE